MQRANLGLYQWLLLLSVILACVPLQWLMNDSLADMLKVTLSVYALARSLNAVISVAQGTEMSIEPMGIGLTLAPGEILDPLNDLTEQVSSVLLLASASLGVQQIVLLIADKPVVRLVLAGLALIAFMLITRNKLRPNWQQGVFRLVIVLTLLRLTVPVMGMASYQLQSWLEQERQQAVSILETTQEEVAVLNQQQDQASGWLQDFRRQLNIESRLKQIITRAEQGVQAAIYLLAEFVLLMLIMPLLFIWLMLRIASRLSVK